VVALSALAAPMLVSMDASGSGDQQDKLAVGLAFHLSQPNVQTQTTGLSESFIHSGCQTCAALGSPPGALHEAAMTGQPRTAANTLQAPSLPHPAGPERQSASRRPRPPNARKRGSAGFAICTSRTSTCSASAALCNACVSSRAPGLPAYMVCRNTAGRVSVDLAEVVYISAGVSSACS